MVNLAQAAGRMLPDLRAANFAALSFWTEVEIYHYIDLALASACSAGLFPIAVQVPLISGQPTYALPARLRWLAAGFVNGRYVETRHASQMDALGRWQTTPGPVRLLVVEGATPIERIRAYPTPTDPQTLLLVGLATPPASISGSAPNVLAPRWVSDYATHYALNLAQTKRTDMRNPGAAAFSSQMADLIRHAAELVYRWDSNAKTSG